MTHNVRTRSIRKLPAWQVRKLMRDKGVTQRDIAELAHIQVTPSFVSRTIARRATVRPSAKTEAIWREIEKRVA